MTINPARARKIGWAIVVAVLVLVAIFATVYVTSPRTSATPYIAPTPTSTPAKATPPAAPAPTTPASTSQDDLAALPLINYDSLNPDLLDPKHDSIQPVTTWQVATPVAEKTAVYSTATSAAKPLGYIENVTVTSRTALPIYGSKTGWLLVGTPGRNVLPSASNGMPIAATFGWVRASDFTVSAVDEVVKVHVAGHSIQLVKRDGSVVAHAENLVLGSTEAPTPSAGTSTYISAVYVDPAQPWTGSAEGLPITLLGSHSETMDTYGGNSAITGIHYFTTTTATSHGCVRVPKNIAALVGKLPVGTSVIFE